MADEKDTNIEAKAKAAIEAAQADDHHHLVKGLAVTVGAFLILVVLVGGGVMAFRYFQRGRVVNTIDNRAMMNSNGFGSRGGFGRGGMMRGRGFVNDGLSANELDGKVTAVNDKQFTMTVNSTSKTVQISDSTRFPNTSATKVAVGDTVVVIGEQDSNGVIQATEIVVNPTSS